MKTILVSDQIYLSDIFIIIDLARLHSADDRYIHYQSGMLLCGYSGGHSDCWGKVFSTEKI